MARTSYFTGFPLNENQTVYVEDVIRQLGDLYTDTEEILDTTIIARDQAVASAQSATSSENIAVTARDDALVAKQEAQDAAYYAEQERLQAQQAAADAEGSSQAAASSAAAATDVLDQVTNLYGDATEIQDAVTTAVDAKDEAVQAKDAVLYALENAEEIYGDTAALKLAVTQAENARDASQDAKTLAEKWASEAEDVPVVPGQFSAKHWAAKASEEVASTAKKNANLSDLTDLKEARSNLGEFATVAEVQSRHIPAALESIRTLGRDAPGDGEGGVYVSADNGSLNTLTDASGRTWYRANINRRRYVDAADYCHRNDAQDATSAIVAALSEAVGRELVFTNPVGGKRYYILSSRVTLPSDVRIIGEDGAILISSSPSQFFYAGNKQNISVEGLVCDGSEYDVTPFWFSSCTGIKVQSCTLSAGKSNTSRWGVHFQGCVDSLIEDCDIFDVSSGIRLNGGGSRIVVRGNRIRSTLNAPIRVIDDVEYIESLTVEGNHLWGDANKSSLIYIGASSNASAGGFYKNVIVANNRGYGAGLAFADGGNADLFSLRCMKGASVYGNYVEKGGDLGLVVEVSEDVAVYGNVVRECDNSGITIAGSSRVSVTGNTSLNNGMDYAGTHAAGKPNAGIRVALGSRTVSISGNTCVDTRPVGSKTQGYGVALWDVFGANSNITIGHNKVHQNRFGPYYVEGTHLISDEVRIGGALPDGDHPQLFRATNTAIAAGNVYQYIVTARSITNLTSASSSTTLILDDVTGMVPSGLSKIGVLLDSGGVFWAVVTAIDGNEVTLDSSLPGVASAGNLVFHVRWRPIIEYV